jgi:hypothetical protein
MTKNIDGLKKKEQEKLALAEKLEAEFGEKRPPPQGKPYYDDFDSYVRDYPAGERYRAWLTNRGRRPVILFLMSDYGRMGAPHGGLPGEYLALTVSKGRDGEIFVCLHDCDDGLARRILPEANQAEADQLINDMKQLAPFDMWDAAKVFNLSWE